VGYDWHAIKTKLVGLWAMANCWELRIENAIFNFLIELFSCKSFH